MIPSCQSEALTIKSDSIRPESKTEYCGLLAFVGKEFESIALIFLGNGIRLIFASLKIILAQKG